MRAHYLYILQCADGSYYVGSTEQLDERIKAHNDGRGPKHTARRRPVRLVYSEAHEDESTAMERERQIKRWSRAKKRALVQGDISRLKRLSKSRGSS